MKNILLYNTLTRKKEQFKPIHDKTVGIYYCGPTVYWTQHIGNLRGSFCADIVVRTFSYCGYDVKFVRNYTDVGHLSSDSDAGEDKMEKGVKREKLSPLEIAKKYIEIYEKNTRELNILEPIYKPRATEHVKEMINMISTLLEKGYAYSTDLAIYFDVSMVDDYTKLSHQKTEDNIAGAGSGDVLDSSKKNKEDFVLWFFRAGGHKNAIQYWESPFDSKLVENGIGFPGWHIECSAMSKKYLGETFDIHMGGIEHVSVHHTNEIAQSEAANQQTFSNYWLHNEHLLVNNGKMSKSRGTSYSLDELKEKGYNPLALRFFFLQANYRSKQNFTWKSLNAAIVGYERLQRSINNLGFNKGKISKEYKDKFTDVVANDFNTPMALAILHEVLKSDLLNEDKLATVLDFDRVLGLDLGVKKNEDEIPGEVLDIFKKRQLARAKKEWEKSDNLRDELMKMGYSIEDNGAESSIKKI